MLILEFILATSINRPYTSFLPRFRQFKKREGEVVLSRATFQSRRLEKKKKKKKNPKTPETAKNETHRDNGCERSQPLG